MKQSALTLAYRGVPVFPVGADKAPRTPRGFHDATTDAKRVRAWTWDGMIGAAIREGEVVLDVDPRNGGDGTLAVFPALPRTRTVRTKNDGRHYYFTVEPGLAMRGSLGPGVDVKRAGKGYVVVPPSPGYAYIRGGDRAPAPSWLLAELVVTQDNDCDTHSDPKFFPFEEGTAYGMAARMNILNELLETPNGARNDALNRAAFVLAQLEAGGELARGATLVKLLQSAELIGLDSWESRNTIESGWSAGSQSPRQAPDREATTA